MDTIQPSPIFEAVLRELAESNSVRSLDAIKTDEGWRLEASLRSGSRRVLTTTRGRARTWVRLDVLTAYVEREYQATELSVRMKDTGRSMASAVS